MLRVLLRDNGPGLSAEQKRKIFDPFSTTKPNGTGLGMATCQRIIEAHGSAIALEDAPGQGAEFLVTLPYIALPRQEIRAAQGGGEWRINCSSQYWGQREKEEQGDD